MSGELTVAETAAALGTSPQTVRTLLRKGELRGDRRTWGSRYVWVIPQSAIDEFLAEYGQFHGRRRTIRMEEALAGQAPELSITTAPLPMYDAGSVDATAPLPAYDAGAEDEADALPPEPELFDLLVTEDDQPAPVGAPDTAPRRRPFFLLRPRVRATIVVVVIGVPALFAYAAARILPGALWFEEVGQLAVFRRILAANAGFRLGTLAVVALFLYVNLLLAGRGSVVLRTLPGLLGLQAASLVIGNMFASAAAAHVQTYLLWQHRQAFGVVDPQSGKDVGFFVFSLPLYLDLSVWLLWLVGTTVAVVALTYRIRGRLLFRRAGLLVKVRHADVRAQYHLAALAALFLLVVAWRLRLEQYRLELGQASSGEGHSFAGAGYVDLTVRSPVLAGLSVTAVVLAGCCLVGPAIAHTRLARPARLVAVGAGVAVVTAAALAGGLAPLLVQRYVVDPNPLVREEPYLARSIAATTSGLGLDEVDRRSYAPAEAFDATDFAASRARLGRVQTWDSSILGARMRQLVTEPPYYRPEDPEMDVVKDGGRTQVTAVSARELDLDQVPNQGDTWVSNRLSYTHGLGLIRYSSTEIGPDRGPQLLNSALGVTQPRIYFGNLPATERGGDAASREVRLLTPTLDEDVADSAWVVANTRRPEVDIPNGQASRARYHYDGTGGIAMSSWPRRAAFALALGSKEMLLSDEITPASRLILHRDVHDRLRTLAPFITWDAEAIPLTANGRVVFVVDGYTTSNNYPYAARVALGDSEVNYARASVLATVDAFTGQITMYLTDPSEPLIRAWREIFPGLFRPFSALPDELQGRLRYPAELFDAQSAAYERFHTSRPDVFVSGADDWSRPIALSGPIEVAGGVDFDESDEDDLRLRMTPSTIYAPPPGEQQPRIVLKTYYAPARGQNLVGSLTGWIDEDGRARLAVQSLRRDPVTLGPAQVSRLVFSTPRVSNLLGLRNLEIRDLDKSSIDSVLLGRPRLLFLPGGLVQIQDLYEGSRGPGAARLLGVTAFVNGRAGLGPDIESAVRQALNQPPRVKLELPRTAVVGKKVRLGFRVSNARREVVTIVSAGGKVRASLKLAAGLGTVTWIPTEPGEARVKVNVAGLDGTRTSAVGTVPVLGPAPRLRLIDQPRQAEAGRPVRVRFDVANGVGAVAEVSTRSGIAFSRRYEIRDGRGVVRWTPDGSGPAVLTISVQGTEGQTVTKRLAIDVAPSQAVLPPVVTLLSASKTVTVGDQVTFTFRADACRSAVAQMADPEGRVEQEWRIACPADPAQIVWMPTTPGSFLLTIVAHGNGSSSQVSRPVAVREPA